MDVVGGRTFLDQFANRDTTDGGQPEFNS